VARLAALVPKPRANLTRYHGVFAPNSKLRSQVTLSGRGKRAAHAPQTAVRIAVPKHGWKLSTNNQNELASVAVKQVSADKPRVLLVEDNEGVLIATELFLKRLAGLSKSVI
jgi:hypothetical protein